MDLSLFQINAPEALSPPKRIEISDSRGATHCARCACRKPIRLTGAPALSRMHRVNSSISPFCESFPIVQTVLGLALFLIAIPALGQANANSSGQSSPQLQSSAEINQRLPQERENLAGSATDSRAGEYRIGPDDLLNVSVFEAPEMNCSVRVSANGEISLQLLGTVHAAGETPREFESILQGLLRRTYMKDPHVGVFVQELQSHPVSVVGAVKMPGVFQIRGTKTVIEVLSMAEGLTDDAGDTVVIMHGAGYAESGNYPGSDSSRHGGMALAPELRGAPVKNYSPQPAAPGLSAATEEVNLKKLLESADSALNVAVRPGDIVKVPRAGIVYVVGEVQKPGGFVLQNNESISVLQALALAMGPTHTSAISHSRIIRTDPATGKRMEIPMNLGKILSGKAPDRFLQPKDIVFVPNSAAKSVLYKGSVAALQTASGVAIYKW
jgi:polysaccharide export outer membrane protein